MQPFLASVCWRDEFGIAIVGMSINGMNSMAELVCRHFMTGVSAALLLSLTFQPDGRGYYEDNGRGLYNSRNLTMQMGKSKKIHQSGR